MLHSRESKLIFARAQELVRRATWQITDRVSPSQQSVIAPQRGTEDAALRIVFLVCESSKWTQQTLFQTLAATPGFDVSFAVTLSDLGKRMPLAQRAKYHDQQMACFSEYGPVSDTLFTAPDLLRDPRSLHADLVFVQQPWGMQDVPRRLAGHIACAHVSYELGVIDDPTTQYALPNFHPWLWRLFVPSPTHQRIAARVVGTHIASRIAVSGSPRLEAWRHQLNAEKPRVASEPLCVVWAPHHSITRRSLRLGTFAWSAPIMLAMASAQPQIRFRLRPHPILWHRLDCEKPGTAQCFRAAWLALPNTEVSEDGDALPVLLSADALITDSASFLAEFMVTGRPILRLTRPDSVGLSEFGAALAPGFYACSTPEQLNQIFEQVILKKTDPLQTIRAALATKICTASDDEAGAQIRDEILRAITHGA